jgi:hypothetical protein
LSDWGPAERRAYLDALDGVAAPSIFAQIARAERLTGRAEEDWTEAVAALRYATADAPDADLAPERELTPASRHQLVVLYTAQEREARAAAAYYRARQQLNQLLAALDDISRPDLGRSPAPAWDDR